MKNPMMLVLIFGLMVILIFGAVIGFLFVTRMGGGNGGDDAQKPTKAVKTYTYNPGGVFTTNIRDSKKLVKADVVIEMTDKKLPETMEASLPRIRDMVLGILRRITEEHVADENLEENVKKEIMDGLTTTFDTQAIIGIYFQEFVIQ